MMKMWCVALWAIAIEGLVIPDKNYVDGECVVDLEEEAAASSDLFPQKWEAESRPEFSLLWEVSYHGTYKVLTNALTKSRFVLYQCGTRVPEEEEGVKVAVPITRAATTSTTYLPFFEMIGERRSVKAYTSDFDYVTSPCLRKLYRDGEIVQAYDPATWSIDGSYEADVTFADNWTRSVVPNPYVMTDTHEDSVLETVEYVQVVGLFFNREAEANAAIDLIVDSYRCTSEEVSRVVAVDDRRKNVLYTNYWAAADGWNVASCPNWYCEVIESAGGDVVLSSATPEVSYYGYPWYSTDQILEMVEEADVVISDGSWPTQFENWTRFADIYDNQGKNGAFDWYERRHVEPDVLLQDLAVAFWPEAFAYERKFLRRLGEPVGERPEDLDAACPDVDAPYDFQHADCPDADDADADDDKKQKSSSHTLVLWLLPLCVALALLACLCLFLARRRASDKRHFELVRKQPPVPETHPKTLDDEDPVA